MGLPINIKNGMLNHRSTDLFFETVFQLTPHQALGCLQGLKMQSLGKIKLICFSLEKMCLLLSGKEGEVVEDTILLTDGIDRQIQYILICYILSWKVNLHYNMQKKIHFS